MRSLWFLCIFSTSLIASFGEEISECVDKSKIYRDLPVVILAFPSNQFGLQEPAEDEELINILKYVRPGNGFEPHPKIYFFTKSDVNGKEESFVYKTLKTSCPPVTETLGNPPDLYWTPIKAHDITWNFNKFLVDKNGYPRYRIGSSVDLVTLALRVLEILEESETNLATLS